MRVLVIGGSGLFGRKTVFHMLQDNEIENVTSMDIAPPPEWFMKQIESTEVLSKKKSLFCFNLH